MGYRRQCSYGQAAHFLSRVFYRCLRQHGIGIPVFPIGMVFHFFRTMLFGGAGGFFKQSDDFLKISRNYFGILFFALSCDSLERHFSEGRKYQEVCGTSVRPPFRATDHTIVIESARA